MLSVGKQTVQQPERDVPLAPWTTIAIGGPATFFAVATTTEELLNFTHWAKEQHLPLFILGAGSNTLIPDEGFEGLVIVCRIRGIEPLSPTTFRVGAGEYLPRLSYFFSKRGLSGLEFAGAIPGTLGGAIVMNAGASGQSMADTLLSVEYLDEKGIFLSVDRAQLEFNYRSSPFQTTLKPIASAVISLSKDSAALERRKHLLEQRRLRQPLKELSLGCIFKNPPSFPLSAGMMIEQAGFKGTRSGDAFVSMVHANFLVNQGKATAKELLSLIDIVENGVNEQFKVRLKREIRLLQRDGLHV